MNEKRLLINKEFQDELIISLSECRLELVIVSAFLRSEVLKWVRELVPENVNVSIVSRWRIDDLLSGTSDLEAYKIARKSKWSFHIDSDLHAKSVLVDSKTLFLGSANMTSKGIHLFGYGNNELGIKLSATEDESARIKSYIHNSYHLTYPMFLEMKNFIESIDIDKNKSIIKWPKVISECISPSVNQLWIDECFFTSFDNFHNKISLDNYRHDTELFNSEVPNKEVLMNSRLFKWLDNVIKASNMEFITFGYITKKLHDAIMTDPKPYRKDVKVLVYNLISWLKGYELYEFRKFEYTISIINNNFNLYK